MSSTKNNESKKNVLIILTDEQRANLHLPQEWQDKNLPAMKLLRQYGVEFVRGFCNTCMCSPSRSTLMTSLYPAQTGVTDTQTFGGIYSPTETFLDPTIPNLATVFRSADYDVQYRGKWHLSKGNIQINGIHPVNTLMRADIAEYGFGGWISPDAGEDVEIVNFGGGYADHDAYYVKQAIEYIRDWNTRKENGEDCKPFFMLLSLVNPHDVLAYPKSYQEGGYVGKEWIEGDLEVPASNTEDLMDNWKPDAQWQNKATLAYGLGSVAGKKKRNEYVNFYGNLLKFVDEQIGTVLKEFYTYENGTFGAPKQLGNDTMIVRLSDHGDMGMAHGGLRQKMFNVYEETIRVPIIFTNPEMVNSTGKPLKSGKIMGIIDVLPTLAGLMDAESPEFIRGKDFSAAVLNPQETVTDKDTEPLFFSFDDVRAGVKSRSEQVEAANRIRCVRTVNWKFARYFHQEGAYKEEYELYFLTGQDYDLEEGAKNLNPMEKKLWAYLQKFPLEFVNLAYLKNPLLDGLGEDVKEYLKDKKQEMAKLLKRKELELLTLMNAKIKTKAKKMKRFASRIKS